MSDWKEGIWISISALIIATFFIFMSTVLTAVRQAAKVEETDMIGVQSLKEYYKTDIYDDVIINQADVVNCIIEGKGKYEVYATSGITVDNYSNVTYDRVWNRYTSDDQYSFEKIKTIIPSQSQYRSFVMKDASGTFIGFKFKRLK